MAACFAAIGGCDVHLFEKQQKTGRKLAATGNGRCNISNASLSDIRSCGEHYHGEDPSFAERVISAFGLQQTRDFFVGIGIPFREESGGRLFPASLQAASVASILRYEAAKRGANIHLSRKIEFVERRENGFVLVTAGKEEFAADAVILAAGSPAYPSLGGDDFGIQAAKSFGHTIIEPLPVILPLNIADKALHTLQGVKWNVRLTVSINGAEAARSEGELLFTGYGISGPAVLAVSRAVNKGIIENAAPALTADFFPEANEGELRQMLTNLWLDEGKKFAFSLMGALNERLCPVLADAAGINPEGRVADVSAEAREKFIRIAKCFPLPAGKPRSFKEAVTAAGGVRTKEIDFTTMESKLVKGLYITGELLDIDGDSGGYNLQFAWSTGAVAGAAASRRYIRLK